MKIEHNQSNLITILLICIFLFSVSCGGGSGDGGGGTEPGETATIALSVSPDSIPANGASSLAITVTLRDSTGTAVDRGTSVEFSTTLGTFPNEDTTYSTSTPNESGTLTVSLISGTTEGTARITVKSNNITQTFDVEFTVQVVGSVTVTSGSPQLLADGVSQTEISATVKDTSNHNMPDGTTVYFSTDLGTLSADSAVTTNGQATVTLTSSTLVGTATITATTAFVSGENAVIFIPGDVGNISLKATPNNLTADGQSTSTIAATVTDAQGNLVANGKAISFSVITGTGTLSSETATTVNGVATVTYTASFTALTETVRAQATNGTTATVDIVLIGQTIGSVTVTAGSSEIVANGTSTTTISATVKDLSGVNVRDGIIVSFTSTAGTLLTYNAATSNGVATVTLRSPTNLGFTEVRATAGGVNDTVTVNFVPGAPFRLTVLAVPTTVQVNGTSSIDVIVYDQYDNPVANGETLTFSAQYGTLNPLTATTSGGMVSTTYRAPNSVPGAGSDPVTVQTTNGRTGTVTITVTEPEVSGITLSANPVGIPADGTSQSTITATVTVAGGGNAPDGTNVTFTITSGGGSITPSATTTNGTATAVLTSGNVTETATIRAESEGVSATTTVEYTATPASLSLGLSRATVQSDNSDSSTITATVLDANFSVIEGITVTFSSNGGQLSASSSETDANGEATVDFSSGTTDKSNRVVTITATVSGLSPRTIPVQVTGTTLTLVTGATNLEIGGNDETTLTITARDAGSVPIFNADIAITSSGSGSVSITPNTGTTDVVGQLQVTVRALSTGAVTVTATGLGATGTKDFNVGVVGDVFTITIPSQDPYSASTIPSLSVAGPLPNEFSFNNTDPDTITRSGGNFTTDGFSAGDEIMVVGSQSNDGTYTIDTVAAVTLTLIPSDSLSNEAADPANTVTISNGVIVRVNAPTQTNVQFATTIGEFHEGIQTPAAVLNVPVAGGVAQAILNSSEAGAASILVSDAGEPSTSDSITVLFSAPSSEASQISLQASATVLPPSTGGIVNSVTLEATVKNVGGEVVGGAPVAFSIENPTGGGEIVSPAVVYTNDYGIAEATFTSGSLSSDSQGVKVWAQLVNGLVCGVDPGAICDDIDIVIGGTAGSVVIGQSTTIESINNDTAYRLPMSVLVSDSNGNPMSGTVVSLNVWPLRYTIGGWSGEDPCGPIYTLGDPLDPANWYPNEDDTHPGESWYRNNILDDNYDGADPQEDGGLTPTDPGHGDGQLTPPLSAAGTIPPTVTTDENGLGTFDLVYVKSSGAWITDQVTATVVVSGTETTGTLTFILPYAENDKCNLAPSPYN